MPPCLELFAVTVTAYPRDADHAPLLADPAAARIARAGDVTDGDLILASFPADTSDYFNDQYTARPEPYDVTCRCGVCCLLAHHPGPVVVLSNGDHWEACDPWPVDDLVLIVPADRLPAQRPAR